MTQLCVSDRGHLYLLLINVLVLHYMGYALAAVVGDTAGALVIPTRAVQCLFIDYYPHTAALTRTQHAEAGSGGVSLSVVLTYWPLSIVQVRRGRAEGRKPKASRVVLASQHFISGSNYGDSFSSGRATLISQVGRWGQRHEEVAAACRTRRQQKPY